VSALQPTEATSAVNANVQSSDRIMEELSLVREQHLRVERGRDSMVTFSERSILTQIARSHFSSAVVREPNYRHRHHRRRGRLSYFLDTRYRDRDRRIGSRERDPESSNEEAGKN
jgi:hypothetical protein